MDKKKAFEKSKKAVSLFFRIRRGFKIYIAFATGILSGIAIYRDLYRISESKPYSLSMAIIAGAFITSVMLLIIKLIRIGVTKIKNIAIKLFSKYKERKSDNGRKEDK